MDIPFNEKGIYAAGPLRLDPIRRTLSNRGDAVPLTGRLFETLLYFMQNSERLVTREELENAVWRGRMVEEGNLQKAISALRRALGDADPDTKYILTVPGRGFQFAVSVRFTEAGLADGALWQDAAPSPLPAKLSPPRLPATIARPRLFAALDRLSQGKMVWIMAPPGAGKTTLICSYRDHARLGGIWYTVDAGDGDPAGFFYYLSEAARNLPAAAAPLPMLTAEYAADLPGFTRRFFRALSAQMPQCSAIVLDNYQDAPETSPLAAILRDAASELRAGLCLIVISRREPPAALARLRANRDVGVLSWEDLRLSETEVSEIVCRADPAMASAAAVLHQRSGGWAAGLTLLLGARGRAASAQDLLGGQAISTETPQAIFDYFASELFEQAPEAVRMVCMATAFLPRFSCGDAVVLSSREDAGQVLETLARRRTFTDRHASSVLHYQYHALFAVFLQRQVDTVFSPAARLDLLERSAVLAARTGDINTALSLHGRCANWRASERLLLTHAPEVFAQGRWQTVLGWLRALPAHVVEGSPWLGYWQSLCEGQVNPVLVRVGMECVYERFVQADDVMGQALSACAMTDSYLLDWRDLTRAQLWNEVLQGIIRVHMPLLPPATELRVYSTFLAVAGHMQQPYDLLVSVLQRVWQLCGEDMPPGERLNAASSLVLFLGMGASSVMAEAAIVQFDPVADLPEVAPLQRCRWHFSKSFGYCCGGRFNDWEVAFRTARQIAADAGLEVLPHWFDTLDAWLPLCEGRLEDAAEILRKWQGRLSDASDLYSVAHYHTWAAWLAILRNEPAAAIAQLANPLELARRSPPTVRGMVIRLVQVYALAGCGRLEEAFAVVQTATAFFASAADGNVRFGSYLAEADILLRLGRRQDARPALAEGFATARRGGHYNTIPWLPEVMCRLGSFALREGIEAEYVTELGLRRGLRYEES